MTKTDETVLSVQSNGLYRFSAVAKAAEWEFKDEACCKSWMITLRREPISDREAEVRQT